MGIYLSNLFRALTGRILIQYKTERVPFTAADIQHLEKIFPKPMYTVNKSTLEDISFGTGQQSVIEYIKRWNKKGSI